MVTLDDSLRSSEEKKQPPLIPHPESLELSDEEVEKLRKILNESSTKEWSFSEAKYRGLELLDLTLMLLDPKGYEQHLQHPSLPPGAPLPPPPPDPVPEPRAFPIRLEADHPREIERALQMLADELRYVKRRPTHWRWALVALHDALGHTLAAHRPSTFLPYTGLGQLTRLFDAVAGEYPDLPQVRTSVQEIDRLRTTYVTWGVTRWPVELKRLPEIFLDCVRVIQRLDSGTRVAVIERTLNQQV
jgi:hypothetical protein